MTSAPKSAERLRAGRAGDDPGEIHDQQAVERSRRALCSWRAFRQLRSGSHDRSLPFRFRLAPWSTAPSDFKVYFRESTSVPCSPAGPHTPRHLMDFRQYRLPGHPRCRGGILRPHDPDQHVERGPGVTARQRADFGKRSDHGEFVLPRRARNHPARARRHRWQIFGASPPPRARRETRMPDCIDPARHIRKARCRIDPSLDGRASPLTGMRWRESRLARECGADAE